MTKYRGHHLALVLTLTTLLTAACSDRLDDAATPTGALPMELSGQIVQENVTRANDRGFVTGDRMGIYVVDRVNGEAGTLGADGNRASNVLFTYDAEACRWTSPTQIYWRDRQTPVDIYGYYPGVNYIGQPTAYEFSVATDQSTEAANGDLSGYEQSDLLWGRAANVSFTTEQIVVKYNHVLAGVRVALKKGTGISDTEWQKLEKIVLVENTVTTATVDLTTGTVAPLLSEASGVTPIRMASPLPLEGQGEASGEASGEALRAVVIPQTVASGRQLISITLDGQTYSHKLEKAMQYEAGKLHNFTLTVNRSEPTGDYEVKVTHDGISPWENDQLSHQFQANAYVVVNCPEPGRLEESIRQAGYDPQTLQSLKVTGELRNVDFDLMRERMPVLRNLNLKEAKAVKIEWDYDAQAEISEENVLPYYALYGNTTLRTLILPAGLKKIDGYALAHLQLMNSTLEVPEGVTSIGDGAFYASCREGNNVTLILPQSIDSIGVEAFWDCGMECELTLSDRMTYIGRGAFNYTPRFYGVFSLPSRLTYIGDNAFGGLGGGYWGEQSAFSGEIEIPQGLKEIPAKFAPALSNRYALNLPQGIRKIGVEAFRSARLNSLSLPKGLVEIGSRAFDAASMPFPLSLPDGLVAIGDNAFYGCRLEGELTFPNSCVMLGENCFGIGNYFTKVTLPAFLEELGDYAFQWNPELAYLFLPKYLERIGKGAFSGCRALQTIVSLNPEPPTLGSQAFEGVYFDKCILQVPESAIEAYRRADGWSQFLNITPYRELAVNITEMTTLDKGMRREGIIRADGAWEVTECPSWCTVEPMQGDGKAEVAITVNPQQKGDPDREGRIAFSLRDKDYTIYVPVRQLGYEYGEDETIVLQQASAGAPKAVPLFIVGEGYNADDIRSGQYLEDMRAQMEYLFSCEPYKTYRNYFTVSTAIAVSAESGIPTFAGSPLSGRTRFNSELWLGEFRGNDWAVRDYAWQYGKDITFGREGETTIMVVMNSNALAAKTYLEDNGRAISYVGKSTDAYPYDQRGYVLREVGGVGFGKLAPEHISHFTFIKACTCPNCNGYAEYFKGKSLGWYDNVSLSGKMNEVPWSHLIFHPQYSQYVDIYEGAYRHARGVYRSEEQSVMSTFIPYYNAISRQSIVKRILEYSGEGYTLEKFVERDKREYPEN